MGKKIRYSKTLTHHWESYRKQYANLRLDADSLYNRMLSDIHQMYPRDVYPEEFQRESIGLEIWFADYNKKLTHYYFNERELKYYLQNCELLDLDGIKDCLKPNINISNAADTKTDDKLKSKHIEDFAVHIPFEKYGFVFSVGLDQNSKLSMASIHGSRFSLMNEETYQKSWDSSDKNTRSSADTFRLAINLLSYIQCFPELVEDGVPWNIPDQYSAISKKIGSAKNLHIKDSTGSKSIPHLRKAHRRHLKSDYFTNMKGKIILVQQTMVNGKAKTVHSSNDLIES